MASKPWTDEEVKILKKLVKLGKGNREINLILKDHPPRGIMDKKFRLSLATPATLQKKWTPREIEKLETLRKQGYSTRDIADNLGRTYTSVKSKIQGLDLPPADHQPNIDYETLNLIEGELCED